MRAIDANALEDRMYHDAFETDSDMQKWDSGCWIRYKMFERAIADAPTIDPDHSLWFRIGEICVDESKGFVSAEKAVEKIRDVLREAQPEHKRGKWIAGKYPFSKCSICGRYYNTANNHVNFCPSCGADMREI